MLPKKSNAENNRLLSHLKFLRLLLCQIKNDAFVVVAVDADVVVIVVVAVDVNVVVIVVFVRAVQVCLKVLTNDNLKIEHQTNACYCKLVIDVDTC